MASRILLSQVNPSLDANGEVAPGSTLRFYQNNTTTDQAVYATAALGGGASLANPLTCDAAGRFPEIWVPDNQGYSVKWEVPGESPITFNDIYGTASASIPPTGISGAGLLDLSDASAGQIKFPATQNPSANPNTLDDYEEGIWVPADASGAGLSLTVTSATYTKIGRLVIANFVGSWPVTVNGTNAIIGGLPVASIAGMISPAIINTNASTTETLCARSVSGATTIEIINTVTNAAVANSGISNSFIRFTLVYFSA